MPLPPFESNILFSTNCASKMDVGGAPAAGWQRPGDRWSVKIDVPRSGRVRNIAPEGLLRSCPALLLVLIAFWRLEPNGHTGPQVTAMDCLAASDHCCGQDIPAIGIWHQHRPGKSLFASFRFRNKLPRRMHTSARINSGGIHFCLCRSNTAYASEMSCTDVTIPMPISGVR